MVTLFRRLKQMVDVRAAQGYSVWKGETFVINGAQGGQGGGIANAGGFAWGPGGMTGGDLNPDFWQAMDEIVAYIVGRLPHARIVLLCLVAPSSGHSPLTPRSNSPPLPPSPLSRLRPPPTQTLT